MEDSNLVIKRAENAVISRDFELAIRLYNSILDEEPNNLEVLDALGNIYVKLQQDEKALGYFESIIRKSPTDLNALNNIGSIYRRLKIYDEAIVVLERALSIDKNNSQINYNIGFTYKSMGKSDEAIKCFETVIAANPSDVLAYNHLASIYAEKKDFTKAISIYKKGLLVDQNHPILQYNLARAYQAIGDDTSAIAAFEAALRAKPGWIDAVKDYAQILIAHRKTRAAYDLVKNAINLRKANPDSELYTLQGKILLNQCNYEDAAESLSKADNIHSDNPETLRLLSKAYIKTGQKAEAVNLIMRAEQSANQKEKLPVIKDTIDVMLSAKKYDNALEYLKKVSPQINTDTELLDLAGQYYITQNQDAKVQDCADKIKTVDDSYEMHFKNWANRYYEIGNNEKSREYCKKYLESNNKDASAWLFAGLVEEALGNLDAALDAYDTALAFDPGNYGAKSYSKLLKDKIKLSAPSTETSSIDIDFGNSDNSKKDFGEDVSSEFMDFLTEDDNIFEKDNTVVHASEEEASNEEIQSEISENSDEDNESLPNEEDELKNQLALESSKDPLDPFENPKKDHFVDNMPVENALDYDDENETTLIDELVENEDDESGYELSDKSEFPVEDKPSGEFSDETKSSVVEDKSLAEKLRAEAETLQMQTDALEAQKNALQAQNDLLQTRNDMLQETYASSKEAVLDSDEDMLVPTESNGEVVDIQDESVYNEILDSEENTAIPKVEESFKEEKIDENRTLDEFKSAQAAFEITKSVNEVKDYVNQVAQDAAKLATEAAQKATEETQKIAEEAKKEITDLASEVQQKADEIENRINEIAQNSLDDEQSAASEAACLPSDEQLSESSEQSESVDAPSEAPETTNSLIDRVSNFLPKIEKMLVNEEDAQKFKKEVALFKQLRIMGEFLPEEEKKEFLLGKTRLLLDFIIARLSGKPGLLRTTTSFRDSNEIVKIDDDKTDASSETQNKSIAQMAQDVLKTMQNLASGLTDETMRSAMQKMAQDALEKF